MDDLRPFGFRIRRSLVAPEAYIFPSIDMDKLADKVADIALKVQDLPF